jgi:hypothetical protein
MRLPTPPRNPIGVGSSLPSSLRNNRRTKVSSAGSRWRDDETPLVARYLAWGGRTCIRVLPAASSRLPGYPRLQQGGLSALPSDPARPPVGAPFSWDRAPVWWRINTCFL